MRSVGVLLMAGLAFATDPALRIDEGQAKKSAIDKPAPAYPLAARQLKMTGDVRLEAVVSVAGDIEEVRILTGNPVLTKAASEAVKKWRFRPFESAGKPSRAIVTLTFEFGAR